MFSVDFCCQMFKCADCFVSFEPKLLDAFSTFTHTSLKMSRNSRKYKNMFVYHRKCFYLEQKKDKSCR